MTLVIHLLRWIRPPFLFPFRIHSEITNLADRFYGSVDGWWALSQGRCLLRTTRTQKEHRHISMSRMVFEPTIPVFERAQIFLTLNLTTAVIGVIRSSRFKLNLSTNIKTFQTHIN
jgi:hypothetical protein